MPSLLLEQRKQAGVAATHAGLHVGVDLQTRGGGSTPLVCEEPRPRCTPPLRNHSTLLRWRIGCASRV